MKRVIVHLIKGEAAERHIEMTKDVSQKFGFFPLHERIAPHLTLKSPFELSEEQLQTVRDTLMNFSQSAQVSPYKLSGFSHFNQRVIFMDVQPSDEMVATIRTLLNELRPIEGMGLSETDIELKLHATVVLEKEPLQNFQEVWDYLHTQKLPNFDMKFDNLAILRKEISPLKTQWILDSEYNFKS